MSSNMASDIFDSGRGKSLKFTNNSPGVKNLIMSNAIYDRYDMDWDKKFTRFGIIDPNNTITNTKEYLFFTKPDLCLFDIGVENRINSLIANNSFFHDAIPRYRKVALQLQSSAKGSGGPFMNMLSNAVTSTLDLPSINADNIETSGNVMGTRMNYRGTSHKSDVDHDFNLEFEDTKYLDIYMLFKMYDEYEKLKWDGYLNFHKEVSYKVPDSGVTYTSKNGHWNDYIISKILHDQISIYKFIVAEDGYRIIYWARVTGCYPNSIPRDAFSEMSGGPQKLNVGWKGHFVRDMDPVILYQFNQIVKSYKKSGVDLPLYDLSNHAMDGRWATMPYIYTRDILDSKLGNRKEYYLRWYE